MRFGVFPEEIGISSEDVLRFINRLEERGLSMHSVLLAKGDCVFTECYWAPFHANRLHRMYSTTKSYVGIAVSQLAAEGKLSLEDKIIDYFPESQPSEIHEYFKRQTIRNMLTMQTCVRNHFWLGDHVEDRVKHYFDLKPCRPPGTAFYYDSEGSFVLGALVEKITGKSFLEYLREKCLDEIGFSKEARCLKCPGGYSWGDSALLATSRDMLLFIRLLAQGGKWNGKQLLSPTAVSEALKKQVDNYSDENNALYTFDEMGYGYQIWRTYRGGFAFCGMHCQYALYDPITDIAFVCTAGNPSGVASNLIFEALYSHVIERFQKESLALCPESQKRWKEFSETRKLFALKGETFSEFEKDINGKVFVAKENPMGIKRFSFRFEKDRILWYYTNEQGDKELEIGRGENRFGLFPQKDYAKEIGSVPCKGHRYQCAASAVWKQPNRLAIKVQVIDEYIGVLNVTVNFTDFEAFVTMYKNAENFLDEYHGTLTAEAVTEEK